MSESGGLKIANILIGLLIVSLFLEFAMLAFSFTHNDRYKARCFALLSGALLFYILGYLLEVMATTSGEAMIALRLENIGIPLIAPFFLLTAISFFQTRLFRTWMIVAAVGYGAVMALTIMFNDKHLLYYSSIVMVSNGSFYTARLGKGPLYIVQQAISMLLMLTSYILLFHRFLRGEAKVRRQMSFFVVGSIVVLVANVANAIGQVPYGIDPMPLSLTTAMMFFTIDLHRHKLMNVVPAAFDMAVEAMDDAMIVLDPEWGFIYCNPKAKRLFPALDKFLGTEDIMSVAGWPTELNLNAKGQSSLALVDPETGTTLYQRTEIHPISNKKGKQIGVLLTLRDITETVQMVNKLEEMAIKDPLTGAFNRRHFVTLVEWHLAMSRRHNLSIGILIMDLDYFKEVNDTYGHMAGDQVLCTVVQAISKQLRTQDVLARYGGEEFVILLIEKEEEALVAFGNRLRKAVEMETTQLNSVCIRITASFGAVLVAPGVTYEAAMEVADKALYAAKEGGRNQVVLGVIDPQNH